MNDYTNTRPTVHIINDPIGQTNRKAYNFRTTNSREERLFQALNMSIKEECPPDAEDHLCKIDATEDPRCEECYLRWATKDFKE